MAAKRPASRGKPLVARLVVDLRASLKGAMVPVAFGVGTDGAILVAARRTDEALVVERGLGSFPKSRLDRPAELSILKWRAGRLRKLVHRHESVVVSHVQPVRGGLLLVGARCVHRPEGPEKNAFVLGWKGDVVRRFTLGDGIRDVRVAVDGTIWVAYFDEGVFGNYGWGHPAPEPLGAPGLVAYSAAGEPRFSYDAAAAGTDDVCDAYAMNLAPAGDVWLYFYTEFPIVRIRGGRYRVWKLGVAGAHALAVRSTSVLLCGSYARSSDCRRIELGRDGRARVTERLHLTGPDGEPLEGSQAIGVGDALYLLQDGRVMVVDRW